MWHGHRLPFSLLEMMRNETPGLCEIRIYPFPTSFMQDEIKGRWGSSSCSLASPVPCMVTRGDFPVRMPFPRAQGEENYLLQGEAENLEK